MTSLSTVEDALHPISQAPNDETAPQPEKAYLEFTHAQYFWPPSRPFTMEQVKATLSRLFRVQLLERLPDRERAMFTRMLGTDGLEGGISIRAELGVTCCSMPDGKVRGWGPVLDSDFESATESEPGDEEVCRLVSLMRYRKKGSHHFAHLEEAHDNCR